ncbi:hypothetical protein [Coxiella burnetii]|uniref:hypothetical protein n=1 Tax=Coxiella burnetii TaxID=777 RepID=UPI0000ED036F|nr:hypothetical protein [Coxiella burnetii]
MPDSLSSRVVNACSLGNIEEVNKTFSSLSLEQKNQIIKFDHYACFHVAAANGHFDVIDFIFNYVKSITDKIPADEAVISVF